MDLQAVLAKGHGDGEVDTQSQILYEAKLEPETGKEAHFDGGRGSRDCGRSYRIGFHRRYTAFLPGF